MATKEIGQENIALSSVTAGEILFGARNKKEFLQLKKDFQQLILLPLNEEISQTFLELMFTYVLSHRLSLPDALIASTAIVNNIELYTFNLRDFRYIKGLKLYNRE
ncbi:MAG: type II toxin-antitoxin system VapC family toxin [Ignavibacteriae bacterium]|nr:type II toxin-antitoxin system VapC family toxin [Ignavibacteriota bacterium]